MERINKYQIMLQYMLIILITYLSGSIFFISHYYAISVVAIFLIVWVCFIFRKNNRFISIKANLYVMAYVCLILLVILINSEKELSPYIAIMLQILTTIMLCYIVKVEDFKRVYTNIIVFFALVSLIGFIIQFIYPTFVYFFPLTIGNGSVDYYNAFIHVFCSAKGYPDGMLVIQNRNSGIFWEPGAYQAFLNIGLCFILDNNAKGKVNKEDIIKILILFITILTTYSTTGYIILSLLLIFYRKTIIKKMTKNISVVFIISILAILAGYIINKYGVPFDYIINKVYREFFGRDSNPLTGLSVWDRIDIKAIALLFHNYNFYFLGMSYSKLQNISINLNANSIVDTMLSLGVPFVFILLSQYYKSSRYLQTKPILFFIILIMIFSSETLFWRPFFLYIAFSGSIFNKVTEESCLNKK